ncbi:hypothetical protein [Brevundimonas sp.]|uniref:hypothetical protein n=1 Tax=Brevundimonas sp. TaxID=1871086 RepID=UPI00391D94F1
MRTSPLLLLVASTSLLALAACGSEADRPDSEGSNTLSVAAAAATTPQATLSAEERETFRQLARSYMDDAAPDLTEGFRAASGFEDEVVALQPTQTHNWRVRLDGGQTYRILGACDNECTNMDFHLLDASGAVVASDTLEDSFPVVDVSPAADGEYTVRFTMVTCTVAPCFAAGRVYQAG